MTTAPLDALRQAAIAREPDRYFAATLAPEGLRYDLIALTAFAAELANIPTQVREPLAGEIRLQWWRDALAANGDQAAAGNPIAVAMRDAIRRHGLPAEIIDGVIDSYADALHGERPANEQALIDYLSAGEGGLFRLAARISAGDETGELWPITRTAGLAYGLSRALLHLPSEGAARLPIPRTLLSDGDLAEAAGDIKNPAASAAIGTLVVLSQDAMREITPQLAKLSRVQRPPFLPLAMVRPNLRALEAWLQRGGSTSIEPLAISRLLRMTWTHASGRF
jgi:phytoene synthase